LESIPVWANCTAQNQLTGCTLHEQAQTWMRSYYKTLIAHYYKPEHDQSPYLQAFKDLFPLYNFSNGIRDGGFFIDTTTSWNTSVYLDQPDDVGSNFIFGILSYTRNLDTQLLATTRCTLSMKYYDANITCSQGGTRPTRGLCAAMAIRQSPIQNFTAMQGYLDSTIIYPTRPLGINQTWKMFIIHFPNTVKDTLGNLNVPQRVGATWIEMLLRNPNVVDSGFGREVIQDIMLPDGIFRQRLALLLNTGFISVMLGIAPFRGNSGKSQADFVCPGGVSVNRKSDQL